MPYRMSEAVSPFCGKTKLPVASTITMVTLKSRFLASPAATKILMRRGRCTFGLGVSGKGWGGQGHGEETKRMWL
jgi:hypothetical protein